VQLLQQISQDRPSLSCGNAVGFVDGKHDRFSLVDGHLHESKVLLPHHSLHASRHVRAMLCLKSNMAKTIEQTGSLPSSISTATSHVDNDAMLPSVSAATISTWATMNLCHEAICSTESPCDSTFALREVAKE
jgi:hypothetical protein